MIKRPQRTLPRHPVQRFSVPCQWDAKGMGKKMEGKRLDA